MDSIGQSYPKVFVKKSQFTKHHHWIHQMCNCMVACLIACIWLDVWVCVCVELHLFFCPEFLSNQACFFWKTLFWQPFHFLLQRSAQQTEQHFCTGAVQTHWNTAFELHCYLGFSAHHERLLWWKNCSTVQETLLVICAPLWPIIVIINVCYTFLNFYNCSFFCLKSNMKQARGEQWDLCPRER